MYLGLQQAVNARILYLDCNAFFASVEQQLHPELRNVPLAVCSHLGPAGTVLAASYQAKAFGVRTGMRIPEAQARCPALRTVSTKLGPYREYHQRFMVLLRALAPNVEAASIDEAVVSLPRNWYGSQAHELAFQVKAGFVRELGEYVTCSIGIAPNRFLAKLATDLQKPDGLVEITVENTREVLTKLDLLDLPGIAERNKQRLARVGIATPAAFYDAPDWFLRAHFGFWGQQWWWRLHGFEASGEPEPLKTMSHQHALKIWRPDRAHSTPILDKLADRLIHRLNRNQFRCKRVGVFCSIKGQRGWWADETLASPQASYRDLLAAIHRCWNSLPEVAPAPIRLIGVSFVGLEPSSRGSQLCLLTPPVDEALGVAVEKVRAKFGYDSIKPATIFATREGDAREQLGFGRVKDRPIPLPHLKQAARIRPHGVVA